MRYNKKKKKAAWGSVVLIIAAGIFLSVQILELAKLAQQTHTVTEYVYTESQPADDVETQYDREERILAALMQCESSGLSTAVGDSGDSIGYYQWQKPSLEEVMGQKLTYDQYYAIATNFEEIHYWTRHAYFELGQTWRWVNCHTKINS